MIQSWIIARVHESVVAQEKKKNTKAAILAALQNETAPANVGRGGVGVPGAAAPISL
jgi:hypothetical protein